MIDDEQLILLVQANECLYNKYSPGYKLADHKKAVWNRIAQEMKLPDELCIKRWACLRDRYGREKRQENLPSGSGSNMKSQWPLLPLMDFLAPHYAPRAVRCSFNILNEQNSPTNLNLSPPLFDSLSSSPLSVPKTNSPLPEAEPQNSFEPILPKPTTPVPNVQKRKRKAPEDLDSSISEAVGAFKKLCEEKSGQSKEKENNPLHGFGKMIVATISSMSASQQIKAMNRVTTLVMEMKLNPED